MVFNTFYHPIAVKIPADQDLENISLSGNLCSTVLMNPKTFHGKPSLVLCGTIPLKFCICGLSGQHSWELRYTYREFRSFLQCIFQYHNEYTSRILLGSAFVDRFTKPF